MRILYCEGKRDIEIATGMVRRYFLVNIMQTLAIALSNRWEVGKEDMQFEVFIHIGWLHIAVARGIGYLNLEV